MRTPVYSGRSNRDVRLAERRGKDLGKLRDVIALLVQGSPLPARLRDHALRGDWNGYRDLHVAPDWLLIYRVEGDDVLLARTGTHADLFDE